MFTERLRRTINLIVALVILSSSALLMGWLIKTKPPPSAHQARKTVPSVAVARLEPRTETAPVVGYGTVRPKNQIKVVPQVSGKLVYTHEDLAPGRIIASGEVLFEIEPTVYEARVRQAEAEIRGLEATLGRHDQLMENLDARIANALQMLAIEEQDYLTSKRLFEIDKVGTQRDVDLVHQKYLQQKDVVVQLRNERAMSPHLKLETQAQLDAARARLSQAQHDLASTKISCPFKARIETVSAYTAQVVTAHFSIATLTDMEAFEISVGIDPRDLRWLARSVRPEALEEETDASRPEVKVAWSLPGRQFSWRGHVSRFERVDEATRTARMVVEIRDVDMVAHADTDEAGPSPALSIGMHCRAELPAEPLVDALMIPRHAIYDDRWVYVFEPDAPSPDGQSGRLGRREVTVFRTVNEEVLVDYDGRDSTKVCGLTQGDLVVVSPLVKPVVGMRVSLRNIDAALGVETTASAYAPGEAYARVMPAPAIADPQALPVMRVIP
ncbi:MAG: efflux RND transporter periplasmic adaptor subunit [Phycisphaerae bacterium]